MRKKPRQTKSTKTARKAPVRKAKAPNRRKHPRFDTPGLWVTELRGDYMHVVPALNLSEGGVFLQGRVASQGITELRLPLGKAGVVRLAARAVHEKLDGGSCGAGYQFHNLQAAQARALRAFLRDLD